MCHTLTRNNSLGIFIELFGISFKDTLVGLKEDVVSIVFPYCRQIGL